MPRPLIWEAWRLHFGTLGRHFGIQGSTGTPQRSPLEPDLDFYGFLVDFGTLLGPTLGSFWRLFRVWTHFGGHFGDFFGFWGGIFAHLSSGLNFEGILNRKPVQR